MSPNAFPWVIKEMVVILEKCNWSTCEPLSFTSKYEVKNLNIYGENYHMVLLCNEGQYSIHVVLSIVFGSNETTFELNGKGIKVEIKVRGVM